MTGRPPGRIRIVAGTHRGRRLRVPAGTTVRPTSERVREAVFDALGPIGGLRVLDLFAGTGAMGLESLSRGRIEVSRATQSMDALMKQLAATK